MVYRTARKVVILVVGLTVVLIGIALIVLPGPAFVVIPAGLAILSTEFLWARRILNRLKDQAAGIAHRMGMGRAAPATPPAAQDSKSGK